MKSKKMRITSPSFNSSRSILPLRQIKGKGKPDPNPAVGQFGTDRAAVRFDQFLDDGQADAGAAGQARTGVVGAVEALEDIRQISCGNSPAAVGKHHLNAIRGA